MTMKTAKHASMQVKLPNNAHRIKHPSAVWRCCPSVLVFRPRMSLLTLKSTQIRSVWLFWDWKHCGNSIIENRQWWICPPTVSLVSDFPMKTLDQWICTQIVNCWMTAEKFCSEQCRTQPTIWPDLHVNFPKFWFKQMNKNFSGWWLRSLAHVSNEFEFVVLLFWPPVRMCWKKDTRVMPVHPLLLRHIAGLYGVSEISGPKCRPPFLERHQRHQCRSEQKTSQHKRVSIPLINLLSSIVNSIMDSSLLHSFRYVCPFFPSTILSDPVPIVMRTNKFY